MLEPQKTKQQVQLIRKQTKKFKHAYTRDQPNETDKV
jgi:hypothetical protein